jgi:hypothetical protein
MTYEKKIYSQHGEDGIIEYIISHLKNSNKTFLEIGYGNGTQNNSLNLSKNHHWKGVGVDLKDQIVQPPKDVIIFQQMIDINSVDKLIAISGKELDFYSVDIDSIDYWLTVSLMDKGMNPKFVCVEIMNSAGEKVSVAPPAKKGYKYNKHHICGASITAWKKFWKHRGYKFLTVDNSGINAFFYKLEYFNKTIENYPSVNYVKSKKWIPYEQWESIFTRRFNIDESTVTGKEKIKDL